MSKKFFTTKLFITLFSALLVVTPLLAINTFEAKIASAQADPDCGEFEKAGPLCLPKNPFGASNDSLVAQTTATGLIATIIRILLYFAGIISVLFLIIGGYYYITSRGNEEQATKGRQTLVYALLGLAIVILSYVIVSVVTNQLTSNI